jgi:hypothetical protein
VSNLRRCWRFFGIPENEDAAAMVVALSLDVGIGHEEYREDNDHHIPAGEDQAVQTN